MLVAAVTGATGGRSPLDSYVGLGKRSPVLAGALGLMMLAMAGLPMTTGFIGKIGVFRAAIDAGYLWAVITALVASLLRLPFPRPARDRALLLISGLARAAEPPNVVVIVADDLGWSDVGFHGGPIDTPSLDRLAGEGVELHRFYTTPICSPRLNA